jgi:cytoskeletal protein RodZ
MTCDLKTLGSKFRKKREEMHLSLKEIENATSIRMAYLQSIEEGDIGKYLSPVYSMGFIKQYASFLGFNGEQIIKEHPNAFKMNRKKQEFDYGLGSIDIRNTNSSAKKSSNILWIGISLGVLVIAWYFAKFLKVI